MGGESIGLIVGISIGVGIGLLLAFVIFLCIRIKRRAAERHNWSERSTVVLPIRVNGVDSSSVMSDSPTVPQVTRAYKQTGLLSSLLGVGGGGKRFTGINAGIVRYSFRDMQRATQNFTTLLGQGAFGPVYRATQPNGGVVAVKVLASNSKQGEREFETEVMLLGRLHHRNLVNLVGYCTDRDHRMLVYEYMSNGSLAGLLYDTEKETLKWEWRVRISQDIARGIEYLHDGAVPPVIHRDIKSANILLDYSMRARVADFGLSKELESEVAVSGFRGTFGYVDPQFITTKTFTEKSDVYSFGVLLFEIITGRNPQQGLMDYVQMATIGQDREGWGELADVRLESKYSVEELETMATVAYSCVEPLPSKRPRMRDVAQSLQSLGRKRRLIVTEMSNNNSVSLAHPDMELVLPAGEWSKPFHDTASCPS